MLKLSNTLLNAPVMSLRTGSPVGTATSMIINPNNLKIEGWHVTDQFDGRELILVAGDVRDIVAQGIVINDHEVLASADELVRLKPILDINFELIGKTVTTESGKRLGKVNDFAVETEALTVKKIYASQSIVKSFSGGNLSIDRTQIVEITDKRVVVDDLLAKSNSPALAPAEPA